MNFGTSHALRLLVSIFSLRQFYEGPLMVFLERDDAGARLQTELERFDAEVKFVNGASRSWYRHRLFLESPYRTTLSFDSDLLFVSPIDELWEPLEREGVLATRFYFPPYGVDGSPEHPGQLHRVAMFERIRDFVDTETYTTALQRLLEERVDINVGVMGISRPAGEAFLTDWAEKLERCQSSRPILADETLAVALVGKYRHFLADEKWNCPADEFFRSTNLADARIIHYFGDGHRVVDIRMGRNPATWAGKKWYEAHGHAARHMDLRRWERLDPTFTGRSRRLFALGDGGNARRARKETRRAWSSVRNRAVRLARRTVGGPR